MTFNPHVLRGPERFLSAPAGKFSASTYAGGVKMTGKNASILIYIYIYIHIVHIYTYISYIYIPHRANIEYVLIRIAECKHIIFIHIL